MKQFLITVEPRYNKPLYKILGIINNVLQLWRPKLQLKKTNKQTNKQNYSGFYCLQKAKQIHGPPTVMFPSAVLPQNSVMLQRNIQFQTGLTVKFELETFGLLENWLLMRGGRSREVPTIVI